METLWKAFTCPGCSCLCDDPFIEMKGNRVQSLLNVCTVGEKKISSALNEPRIPNPIVRRKKRGQKDYQSAVEASVQILKAAKRPVIYGLEQTGSHAQEMGLKIARKLKGTFLGSRSLVEDEYLLALKAQNLHFASLDEIRDCADLILFIECNPHELQPRHLSHISVYPRGKYRERGFEDRTVITIGSQESEMRKVSQQFVLAEFPEIQAGMELVLRLVRGERLPASEDDAAFLKLAQTIKRASYGALFLPASLLSGAKGKDLSHVLISLVDALNNGRRFVLCPVKVGFNSIGLNQLLLRETGTPFGFDFFTEKPLVPGQAKIEEIFSQRDAVLIVASDPYPDFSQTLARHFRDIGSILLDPFHTKTSQQSDVVFPTAMAGLEADEIAYRTDGIPVRLQKVMNSSLPNDFSILQDIYASL
jgi:formylmethanofuran dehydrogenase subunit B